MILLHAVSLAQRPDDFERVAAGDQDTDRDTHIVQDIGPERKQMRKPRILDDDPVGVTKLAGDGLESRIAKSGNLCAGHPPFRNRFGIRPLTVKGRQDLVVDPDNRDRFPMSCFIRFRRLHQRLRRLPAAKVYQSRQGGCARAMHAEDDDRRAHRRFGCLQYGLLPAFILAPTPGHDIRLAPRH
ncbi:MAG: hypothetical protein RLN87_06280 [Parasphingopyxis sp.]